MTIAELLENEDLRRREFPVAEEKIFLAHAAVCPLPRRVSQAIAGYATAAARGDQEASIYPQILDEGRSVASQLLGCQPEEVALVGPTSLGLSLMASGLRFRRTDNILIYFDDYPSNVYPWMALAEKGVEVRLMNTRGLGVIRPRDVLGQIDENTRLVALASCHFISGYRLQVEEIGRALHQRGILFCLDGIQSLGAFPTPVQHVDMMATDGHKWLLSPCGAGLLYVRREIQDRINPVIYGWNNVRCPQFVAQEQLVFRAGPHKFEPGTYNLFGLVGLIAAMRLLLEVGIEKIGQELLRKRSLLVEGLKAKGYTVLHAEVPPENASGIISFSKSGVDLAAMQNSLAEKNVVVSLRTDRRNQQYIRLSPHFYNTDRELRGFLELV